MLVRCGTQIIDLTQPVVMGVLNVTPDSFSDGGKFLDIAAAVAHGLRMVEEGAALINDVRALSEEGALEAAAGTQCAVCVMHMQGDPRSMQLAPHYADVVNEVKAFLEQRVNVCRAAGMAADRIVIDPGFGFGKTLEHNLQLLRHLRQLGLAACGERPPMGSPHAANGWPWMDTL